MRRKVQRTSEGIAPCQSAHNRLTGKVKGVKEGIVTAEVVVELPGGQEVISVITMTSVQNLGIKAGSR